MNKIYSSTSLFNTLSQIIEIPENATEFTLRLKAGEPPLLTVSLYPEFKVVDGVIPTVTKKYYLTEIE